MANGQNIDYSEKENGPRASSAPALGLNTIIFKHVYWYMLQISGERLQDHWSSGISLIGHSQMELTDVDFYFQNFHWLFENNETDQGDCLTAFGYFKEMSNFFYIYI